MKKYISPNFEILSVDSTDIITTSPGTDTPVVDEGEGNWWEW